MVNILNVYDTVYGNTKEVAGILAQILASRNHKVITSDASKASMGLVEQADFIFIGSPTHYWRPTRKIWDFILDISRSRIRGKYCVLYDTRLEKLLAGSAVGKMVKAVLALNFKVLGKGEYFYVESSKGPLKLGEVGKCERLANKADSFIEGAKIESIMDRHGFVPEEA